MTAKYVKKLIEVALPLDAVNVGCREDKNRKTGHIRNLHKWFAPMPLPAWRALLFATLVDDPGDASDDTRAERQRLLGLVERLSAFDAYRDADLMRTVREELRRAMNGELPTVVDPFCGGGSTILEAQRLGLPTQASDLNPIPILITTVLCRVPSLFHGRGPVHPKQKAPPIGGWNGVAGLLADIQTYAQEIREAAWKLLSDRYPNIGGAIPFAYRWALTVATPDPAFQGRHTPLVSDWWLSKHKKASAWIKPDARSGAPLSFTIERTGEPIAGTTGRSAARCLFSGSPIGLEYVRAEGRAGRLGQAMLGIGARSGKETQYFAPDETQLAAAGLATPPIDGIEMPEQALSFRVQQYGMTNFASLFTSRQVASLSVFASLVNETHAVIHAHARTHLPDDNKPLEDGGCGARAYADAVTAVLSLAIGKMAQSNNVLVRWFTDPRNGSGKATPAFDRQSIPMVWDFVETNPFGGSVGDWTGPVLETALRAFELCASDGPPAQVVQQDARDVAGSLPKRALIATDPPYYANIGYADLSDFFYLWVRPAARNALPRTFSTIATPKATELIATRFRHNNNEDAANRYFRDGFANVFGGLARAADHRFPMLIVYAHKQSEEADEGVTSTGWEVFLGGLIDAGLSVVATWPVETSTGTRMNSIGTNSLASAIFVIARERPTTAKRVTRTDFVRLVRSELVETVRRLKSVRIAPVDLAQATLGPGIGVFSSFAAVIEPDGGEMSVGSALSLINELLDEHLSAQEGDFDSDTRFAITWYEVRAFEPGPYGEAETLAKARAVTVEGVVDAGIIKSGGGKVCLLKRSELPVDWDPAKDKRLTVWEATQHLIKRLEENGEDAAAVLLDELGAKADSARDLAYRLYSTCERRGWADEARAYNGLVSAWSDLERLAGGRSSAAQQTLL